MYKHLFISIFISIFISCSSDSENLQTEPEIDSTEPEIEFSIAGFPENPSTQTIVVSNTIEVNIDAKDAGGVAKIEAFINNNKMGEDTTAPYQIIIDLSSYASKTETSNKFKNYILKVSATDKSGNISSKEQTINIDNELPVISEVSLMSDVVINGDDNLVTFSVSDNENLGSVKMFLNDGLIGEIADGNYEILINTLVLEDGDNVFKIEATDSADNIATFEVNFISDNTGPEINLDSILENLIFDQPTTLKPQVTDEHSEVIMLEILIEDTHLVIFDETITDYELDFNSDQFPTGTNNLVFIAKDYLENESRKEIPIEIYRRLLTINFPANYYDPQLARIFVFASSIDGKVLDVKRVFKDTQQIILRTQDDIEPDKEFSLTIAEYQSGDFGNHSNLTTLQNLKSSTLGVINMKTAPRFEYRPRNPYSFPIDGFDPDDVFNSTAYGYGYSGGMNFNEQLFNLDRRKNTTSDINTDIVYFWLKNETLNEYSYAILDWDLPDNFIFNQSLMTTDGIEKRFYQTSLGSGDYVTTMNTIGYFSEIDFKNNVFHTISSSGYGFMPEEGVPYFYNQNIYKTRYEFTMPNYYTSRIGEPLEMFQDLSWTFDYSLNGKEINISKTGTGHSVGNVYIGTSSPESINGLNISYGWKFIFDSDKTEKVTLPELPEELQAWGFNDLYKNNDLNIIQVEMKKYDGILNYEGYLQKVIKDNNFIHTVTPVIESKFIRPDGFNSHYYKEVHTMYD